MGRNEKITGEVTEHGLSQSCTGGGRGQGAGQGQRALASGSTQSGTNTQAQQSGGSILCDPHSMQSPLSLITEGSEGDANKTQRVWFFNCSGIKDGFSAFKVNQNTEMVKPSLKKSGRYSLATLNTDLAKH